MATTDTKHGMLCGGSYVRYWYWNRDCLQLHSEELYCVIRTLADSCLQHLAVVRDASA